MLLHLGAQVAPEGGGPGQRWGGPTHLGQQVFPAAQALNVQRISPYCCLWEVGGGLSPGASPLPWTVILPSPHSILVKPDNPHLPLQAHPKQECQYLLLLGDRGYICAAWLLLPTMPAALAFPDACRNHSLKLPAPGTQESTGLALLPCCA